MQTASQPQAGDGISGLWYIPLRGQFSLIVHLPDLHADGLQSCPRSLYPLPQIGLVGVELQNGSRD